MTLGRKEIHDSFFRFINSCKIFPQEQTFKATINTDSSKALGHYADVTHAITTLNQQLINIPIQMHIPIPVTWENTLRDTKGRGTPLYQKCAERKIEHSYRWQRCVFMVQHAVLRIFRLFFPLY